jgi:hypothetical protein
VAGQVHKALEMAAKVSSQFISGRHSLANITNDISSKLNIPVSKKPAKAFSQRLILYVLTPLHFLVVRTKSDRTFYLLLNHHST